MWNHMGAYGGGWGMGFGMTGIVLPCVLVIVGIVGIVALVRWASGSGPHSHPHSKSAVDILKERCARGEIGKQEFEEKKHPPNVISNVLRRSVESAAASRRSLILARTTSHSWPDVQTHASHQYTMS